MIEFSVSADRAHSQPTQSFITGASGCRDGVAAYALLTGHQPALARLDSDQDFDRHILAALLSIGLSEDGALPIRIGIDGKELMSLAARWFPHASRFLADASEGVSVPDDDEVVMVRDLLLAHRSTTGEESRWLACMIARRAMEPNHLWEDLGLRDRNELSRLMERYFSTLAGRNTKNMRWKRFFYRALCESDGLVMCSTPVCSSCGDFEICFGREDGESRLANRRRNLALKMAAAAISP